MTTVDSLARGFVETQGYEAGTVPEAEALATACETLLTRHDGLNFSIVCIVDAAARGGRGFDFDKASAKAILSTCAQRYSGTMQGAVMPATLVVVEVRRSARPQDLARLKAYSNRFFDQNAIHAFVVDTGAGKVVTATRFSWLGGIGWRRFLKREVRGG